MSEQEDLELADVMPDLKRPAAPPHRFDNVEEGVLDPSEVTVRELRGDAAAKASIRAEEVPVWQSKMQPTVSAPQSKGPSAAWVLNHLRLKERGDFKDSNALQFASCLEVSATDPNMLFCSKCATTFGTRRNVWERHCMLRSHQEKLAAPAQKRIVLSLEDEAKETARREAQRQRLTQETTDHRVRVARALFATNFSINGVEKPGELKELLEENRPRRINLGTNLAEDTKVPLILERTAKYTKLFEGHPVLASFDSSPRLDDVYAVMFSVCTDDFDVVDLLGALRLMGRPLNGPEWLDVILTAMERYKISRKQLQLGNSDRGGPNKPCVRSLGNQNSSYLHIYCFSHTFALGPEKCSFTLLEEFSKHYNSIFKHSDGARSVFFNAMGESWKRKSQVKWFTKFEQREQLMRVFGKLESVFLKIREQKYCKESIGPLLNFFQQYAAATSNLAVQLCAYQDVFRPVCQACYYFECSKFISPFVYPRIKEITDFCDTILKAKTCPACLPNLFALIAKRGDPGVWTEKVVPCIQRGIEYIYRLFVVGEARADLDEDPTPISFKPAIEIFRFARIFNPFSGLKMIGDRDFKIAEWKVHVGKVISDELWDKMMDDMPKLVTVYDSYLKAGAVHSLDPDSLLKWWKDHYTQLGAWAKAAQIFVLCRPSSAVVERLFSVYKQAVLETQLGSHESTQELRVQLNWERFSGSI